MWVRPGDTIRALTDKFDLLGVLAVTGADAAATIRRAAELLRGTIRIQVRGDDGVVRPARVIVDTEHTQMAEGTARTVAALGVAA
jgi:hypothetical protein